jgi:hypothetical protein
MSKDLLKRIASNLGKSNKPRTATGKYIVWIKEKGSNWEPNGDGPMGIKTAERVAEEVGKMFQIPTRVLPEGQSPVEAGKKQAQSNQGELPIDNSGCPSSGDFYNCLDSEEYEATKLALESKMQEFVSLLADFVETVAQDDTVEEYQYTGEEDDDFVPSIAPEQLQWQKNHIAQIMLKEALGN